MCSHQSLCGCQWCAACSTRVWRHWCDLLAEALLPLIEFPLVRHCQPGCIRLYALLAESFAVRLPCEWVCIHSECMFYRSNVSELWKQELVAKKCSKKKCVGKVEMTKKASGVGEKGEKKRWRELEKPQRVAFIWHNCDQHKHKRLNCKEMVAVRRRTAPCDQTIHATFPKWVWCYKCF